MTAPTILFATAFLFGTTIAGAQATRECGPEEQTAWWPRRELGAWNSTSAADLAAMRPKLSEAEALVRKTNYGTPRGFAIRPVWVYGDPSDRTRLRTYVFSANSFASCSRYDEHGADLMVVFNPYPGEWSINDHPDENGDRLYTEPARSDALFGSTATFGHFGKENTLGPFVLFTVEGISPTIPVTREEYLRALIFALEGKNQERLKDALAYASKTQYQRWLEDAPARKKRNDEILAGLSQASPAEAAKVRADLEKVEREGEASLRKSDPQERAELDRKIATIKEPGDRLRAQIAAMTPAERASPAYSYGFPYELLSRDTPNARPIVRINPAFYRTDKSVTEVRAILVRFPGVYKQARAQHEQLFREFDWGAVKRMVGR